MLCRSVAVSQVGGKGMLRHGDVLSRMHVMRHASYYVVMCYMPTAADVIFSLRATGYDVPSTRGAARVLIASFVR